MPNARNSPRKSIISFVADGPASENVPPVPSLPHSHSNGAHSATNGATTSDSTRPQLTTLSSNDLNGTARTPAPTPPANGFTAINTGGFTSVNASSPPVRLSPSQKPVAPAPAPTTNGRNYSSPYDSSPFHGAPTAQKASTPPKAPPLVTATTSASGFQAINSPVVANGVSARDSPTVQHVQLPQLPASHTVHAQAQAQPTSRSNTPIMHHHHRSGLTQQRSSRSSTPIAPAMTSQPMQQAQPAPVSSIQSHQSPRPSGAPIAAAPATQPQPPYAQPAAARAPHVVNVAPVAPVPATAYGAPQAPPVLRSHPHEAALIPAQAQFAESDLGLLQCEVLGSLMQYLFPRITSPPDESVLLHKIESLWHLGTAHYRKEIGQLYDLHAKILMTWITERRKIQQLRHTFAYSPAVPATEMVERLLALNDLRMMRLKWKNMSNAVGLSTEDLLCRTFTIMTNTAGTEHLFKDGLDRLNEGIFEFLRTEDMRILMHSKR